MLRKLQEAGWPSPIEIKCVKFDIDSVLDKLEKSHTKKAFYAEVVRWLIESEGKPTFRKVTGIEDDDAVRKAQFGDISNKESIKRLIEYVSKAAPGQIINFAKTTLEPEIAEYLKYYVTKTAPPETLICEKLKGMGIYTIAYIEDTFDYGPLCKIIINPQGLLRSLVEEPSRTAEFATVAKLTEWIISNTNENIVFVVDNEESPSKVIVASISPDQKEIALDLLSKFLNDIMNKENINKNIVINTMIKYLL